LEVERRLTMAGRLPRLGLVLLAAAGTAIEAFRHGSLRMTAGPPLGVGVIGCGRIGQIHSNTLAFRTPGARLVAVTDPFEEMGRKCQESVGGIPDYHREYREMLDRPDLDAVIVA
jgi:threonine dehydrogenase-like Zn-dependent dehydrogenase